jgi:hypothetical protein
MFPSAEQSNDINTIGDPSVPWQFMMICINCRELKFTCIDNQKYPFCEIVKMCNDLHHCVPLVEVVKKTYMERSIWSLDERAMPLRKYMNYRYY